MALNRVVADTHVGPYRILRRINRGGQGSVYLGYDRRLGRRVAIKIYRLPSARTARRRLLHEAQLVASIQSPKVVQIHDVLESRGHVALVMEYVPGCDLEEFLAAVRPSLDSILTIALDIAGALAMARLPLAAVGRRRPQQQIVHGDLKASNVLIADSGQVKLTDFGIAHRGAQGAAPGASQSAMSPEQYLGKPLDVRADLFALGCLLYRMLSGAQPFMDGPRLDPRRLLEGERCRIYGDGAQTRDYVFVDDVVDAFVRATGRGSGLTVNIGTGVETSVNELHATMAASAGVDADPEYAPARAGELARSALDAGRARIHLGWEPFTDLPTGTAAVLEWFANQRATEA